MSESLKRGWFYGGEEFRAKLEELAYGTLRKASTDPNRAAGAPADHSSSMAKKIVIDCLRILKIDEAILPAMKKGGSEKAAVASLIRNHTSVGLRWVAERLDIGHARDVTVRCSEISHEHPKSKEARRLINTLRKNSKIIT